MITFEYYNTIALKNIERNILTYDLERLLIIKGNLEEESYKHTWDNCTKQYREYFCHVYSLVQGRIDVFVNELMSNSEQMGAF